MNAQTLAQAQAERCGGPRPEVEVGCACEALESDWALLAATQATEEKAHRAKTGPLCLIKPAPLIVASAESDEGVRLPRRAE